MVPNPPPPNPVLRRGWQVAGPTPADRQGPPDTGAGEGPEGGPGEGGSALGGRQEGVQEGLDG